MIVEDDEGTLQRVRLTPQVMPRTPQLGTRS